MHTHTNTTATHHHDAHKMHGPYNPCTPQVLFNASVKYNLDPFDAHTEAKLHEVLEIVQMKAVVDGFADGLQQLALTLTPNPNHNPNPNPNSNPSPSPNPDQVAPYAAGKRSFYEEPRYVGNKGAQPSASWLSRGCF